MGAVRSDTQQGTFIGQHWRNNPAVLIVELPLPPKAASPNAASSSARRWKAVALGKYKDTCYGVALVARMNAKWQCCARARLSLEFCYGGGRRQPNTYYARDADNAIASVKAAIDAMVAAKLIADDSWDCLELGNVTRSKAHGPFVRVILEDLS